MPKLSIIVAAYNTAQYLQKCLDSLINQTFRDIEIICIDDASTDATNNILQRYREKDSRIVVHNQSTNQGLSCARNKGLELARGEFVMFCDSDDYYSPKMCDVLYKAIIKYKTDIVESAMHIIYQAMEHLADNDKRIYQIKYKGQQNITDDIIYKINCMVQPKIFRMSIIRKYHLTFPEHLKYEDAYFTRAYLSCSKKIYFLNQKLYHYVRRQDSIMSNTWSKSAKEDYSSDHLYVIIELYNFWRQQRMLTKYKNLFWRLFSLYAHIAFDSAKTSSSQKKVRAEAQNFIFQHRAEIKKINLVAFQDMIRAFPFLYFYI